MVFMKFEFDDLRIDDLCIDGTDDVRFDSTDGIDGTDEVRIDGTDDVRKREQNSV